MIPGGIHLDGGKPLIDGPSPLYFERARGAYVWDVDGNEYVDFIMAYGPPILGHARPEVDAAGIAQLARGALLSLNHPLHVAFVERVLQRFVSAEMGAFFKAGSEATTAAIRIARRATGRRKVARCGYHGWHDWCLPEADFVPRGLDEQVAFYDAREPATLRALLAQHPDEFAAVILAPEMLRAPDRATVQAIAAAAREHGALFVFDEVKTGLRAPEGSMQAFYDLQPDLTTLSKALGNGWPIAAVIGTREAMRHGEGLPLSATYHADTAAMAAAMETLRVIDRDDAPAYLEQIGRRFVDGLNAAARRNRFPASAYGEPIAAMPFLAFEGGGEPEIGALKQRFYADVLSGGVLVHPNHLWYVSTAHTEADVDRALAVFDAAMARCTASFAV